MAKARVIGGYLFTSDGRASHFTEKELYAGSNWLQRQSLPGVDEDLVDLLEGVREDVRRPVRVTSAVRSKKANEVAGGDPLSLHLTGGAADIAVDGIKGWQWVPFMERATAKGTLGRWGIYSFWDHPHVHLDIDRDRPRRRFIREGGVYSDIELWLQEHFPGQRLEQVDPRLANAILGF